MESHYLFLFRRRVLIILELTKLKDGAGLTKIGEPVNIQDALPKQEENIPQSSSSINSYGRANNNARGNTSNNMVPINMSTTLNDQLTFPISNLSPYLNK